MAERASNICNGYVKVNFSSKELVKAMDLHWPICCGCFASLAKMNS